MHHATKRHRAVCWLQILLPHQQANSCPVNVHRQTLQMSAGHEQHAVDMPDMAQKHEHVTTLACCCRMRCCSATRLRICSRRSESLALARLWLLLPKRKQDRRDKRRCCCRSWGPARCDTCDKVIGVTVISPSTFTDCAEKLMSAGFAKRAMFLKAAVSFWGRKPAWQFAVRSALTTSSDTCTSVGPREKGVRACAAGDLKGERPPPSGSGPSPMVSRSWSMVGFALLTPDVGVLQRGVPADAGRLGVWLEAGAAERPEEGCCEAGCGTECTWTALASRTRGDLRACIATDIGNLHTCSCHTTDVNAGSL